MIFDIGRVVSILENVQEDVAVLIVNVGKRIGIDRWL